MRFFSDGAHLGFGQLLLARLGVAAEHPAGGADLDHFGAELALTADLVAKLLHPVGDALFLCRPSPGSAEGRCCRSGRR